MSSAEGGADAMVPDGVGRSVAADRLVGIPDCFERLWTPYRMAYIQADDRPSEADTAQCPFCRVQAMPDDEGLVVHRGEHAFVVMNLYPYSPGHMLVCPCRHVADYVALRADETAEVAALTQAAIRTLTKVSSPAGFNLGVNQGAVAGAGIAGHMHQHVVPRWAGDTNFLPIVARTRAVPQLLADARGLLAEGWQG